MSTSPFGKRATSKPKTDGPKPQNRCGCGGMFAFDTHPTSGEQVCAGCYAEACADAFYRAAERTP